MLRASSWIILDFKMALFPKLFTLVSRIAYVLVSFIQEIYVYFSFVQAIIPKLFCHLKERLLCSSVIYTSSFSHVLMSIIEADSPNKCYDILKPFKTA